LKKITLFSDGSSLGNPGAGGWACILRYKNNEKILSGGQPNVTNNQMELLAVIEGLKALNEPCDVDIFTDSNYVVKSINEWLGNWIAKNWKNNTVKNRDLWEQYLEVSRNHKIKAYWVKGHAGHEENEKCDKIAKAEAEQIRRS
jgi:ribonuclease HI